MSKKESEISTGLKTANEFRSKKYLTNCRGCVHLIHWKGMDVSLCLEEDPTEAPFITVRLKDAVEGVPPDQQPKGVCYPWTLVEVIDALYDFEASKRKSGEWAPTKEVVDAAVAGLVAVAVTTLTFLPALAPRLVELFHNNFLRTEDKPSNPIQEMIEDLLKRMEGK